MAEFRIGQFSPEAFEAQTAVMRRIAERYRSEPDFRATVDGDARAALAGMGLPLPEDLEVKVAANTADTVYFVLPPDPNVELADEALLAVAGGTTSGTGGSAGTLSTLGCIPSCWSSFGCASSAGTSGSG